MEVLRVIVAGVVVVVILWALIKIGEHRDW